MISFDLSYLEAPSTNTATLDVGASTYELWGEPNIKSITMYNIFCQIFSSLNLWLPVGEGSGGRDRLGVSD